MHFFILEFFAQIFLCYRLEEDGGCSFKRHFHKGADGDNHPESKSLEFDIR